VTLYPKVNSLVIDRDVHDDLTDRQRDVLAASADAALAAVGEEAATDAEMAAEFCRAGGTIVAAPPSAVRALNRAATPVYAELARDERTKRLVQAILELKSSRTAPAEARRPCGDLNAPREAAATRVGPGIPDGVYRTTMSTEELVAAGFASSLEDPTEYDGVHTLTLNRGDLVDYIPSGGEFVPCGGTYSSAGNRVKFRFEVDCSGEMTARWSLRDGWLRFTRVTSDNPVNTSNLRAVFGAKPFRKLD
jgi:hypothetical protein